MYLSVVSPVLMQKHIRRLLRTKQFSGLHKYSCPSILQYLVPRSLWDFFLGPCRFVVTTTVLPTSVITPLMDF